MATSCSVWLNLIYSLRSISYKRGGIQKTQEFIYKKLCIYSYKFKLQSLSNYSAFDAMHLLRWVF